MSLVEWFASREVLLTGATSELGRALLEKILRTLPNVRVYTIIRSRNGFMQQERINKIFTTPGFERLREEQPNAISRVKIFEGNLLYEGLGIMADELQRLKNIEIAFHAAGPIDDMLEFCQSKLPRLRAMVVATSLLKDQSFEDEKKYKEKFSNLPMTVLRLPVLSPAYKEPIPGLVEVLRPPTALMISAGYALGRPDLPAEIVPTDLAVNALIIAAWDRGTSNRSDSPVIYNMPSLGCTWSELIAKGQLAHRKFPYPTFGIRGMTSIALLHWTVVCFLEWLPSTLCDNILSLIGAKPRCIAEYERVRKALESLQVVKSQPVDRTGIYQLEKCLSSKDRENYPILCDIDLEGYVLCVAASARKNCVNETNLNIVKNVKRLFIIIILSAVFYFIMKK